MIRSAAEVAGIDPDDLDGWAGETATEAALESDKAAARRPRPAARVLDEKLANWSGGRRYTCPSYEITRLEDEVTISVPGFQPFAVYNTILANLVPGLDRRDLPGDVREVLEWSAIPVSTQEVAVMCDIDFEDAREQLGRVAAYEPVGADGFWTLPALREGSVPLVDGDGLHRGVHVEGPGDGSRAGRVLALGPPRGSRGARRRR